MCFQDKIVVVTGGAQGIGRSIVETFRKAGAKVCIIDIMQSSGDDDYFQGDLSKQETIEKFATHVLNKYGQVHYIINNALPFCKGIDDCSYEEFQNALNVGVTAPFYLVKLLKDHLGIGASIVNISSSRDRQSMPQTESYTAAKGGISALTHALAISLRGKARVNSISPGWIETKGVNYDGPDAKQQPVGRVGSPKDIANLVAFLCSDKAGFITAENICIDGGMTHQMVYHGEHGWSLE